MPNTSDRRGPGRGADRLILRELRVMHRHLHEIIETLNTPLDFSKEDKIAKGMSTAVAAAKRRIPPRASTPKGKTKKGK